MASLEPTERNVGLHCKEASQLLDASPSKLEIFLFSWSRIELFPPVDTRCLSVLKDVKDDQKNKLLLVAAGDFVSFLAGRKQKGIVLGQTPSCWRNGSALGFTSLSVP